MEEAETVLHSLPWYVFLGGNKMIKLYTEDGWPNFSEDNGILSTGAPIIFIWGGRGTGKTYGALKHVHQTGEEFCICAVHRSRPNLYARRLACGHGLR